MAEDLSRRVWILGFGAAWPGLRSWQKGLDLRV